MPTMSTKHKIEMLSNFIFSGRFREIYNMFWVYPFWWNRRWASLLLNKVFPRLGIDMFPPFLEIEPTTICTMRCICCEHTYWKEPSKNMSFSQFKKIFDDFGRPKWLGLTGIGSSYLNKDYHKMLAYAKSRGTLLEVFDHFAHFKSEEQIRELIEIGPDFQFVSMYGASKKSFEKVCVGSNFDVIVKNIKTFVRLKKQMKKRFPVLNFHYIITSESKDEILKFLDFVHSLNADIGEILVTPMLHSFKEAKKYAVSIDKNYVDRVRKRAKELNIAITVNISAKKEAEGLERKPQISCCREYIMPFIFVDGNVTPCCGQNEGNLRDWQNKTSLGNALNQSFRSIWYSPKYRKMRQMIRANNCPAECAHCPVYHLHS